MQSFIHSVNESSLSRYALWVSIPWRSIASFTQVNEINWFSFIFTAVRP